MGYIYCLTNNINGKKYIGQTSRLVKERVYNHCRKGKSSSAIRCAIQKYGIDNFTIQILEICDIKDLDRLEIFWIQKSKSLSPSGYNLETGGCKNKKASKKLKEKLSKAKLGKFYGPRKKEAGLNISIGKGCQQFQVYKVTGEYVGQWQNREECARNLNLNPSHIISCLANRRKTHKGFIFVGVDSGKFNK